MLENRFRKKFAYDEINPKEGIHSTNNKQVLNNRDTHLNILNDKHSGGITNNFANDDNHINHDDITDGINQDTNDDGMNPNLIPPDIKNINDHDQTDDISDVNGTKSNTKDFRKQFSKSLSRSVKFDDTSIKDDDKPNISPDNSIMRSKDNIKSLFQDKIKNEVPSNYTQVQTNKTVIIEVFDILVNSITVENLADGITLDLKDNDCFDIDDSNNRNYLNYNTRSKVLHVEVICPELKLSKLSNVDDFSMMNKNRKSTRRMTLFTNKEKIEQDDIEKKCIEKHDTTNPDTNEIYDLNNMNEKCTLQNKRSLDSIMYSKVTENLVSSVVWNDPFDYPIFLPIEPMKTTFNQLDNQNSNNDNKIIINIWCGVEMLGTVSITPKILSTLLLNADDDEITVSL